MLTNSRMEGRDDQAGAAPKPKDGRDRKVHIFHSAANPFFFSTYFGFALSQKGRG